MATSCPFHWIGRFLGWVPCPRQDPADWSDWSLFCHLGRKVRDWSLGEVRGGGWVGEEVRGGGWVGEDVRGGGWVGEDGPGGGWVGEDGRGPTFRPVPGSGPGNRSVPGVGPSGSVGSRVGPSESVTFSKIWHFFRKYGTFLVLGTLADPISDPREPRKVLRPWEHCFTGTKSDQFAPGSRPILSTSGVRPSESGTFSKIWHFFRKNGTFQGSDPRNRSVPGVRPLEPVGSRVRPSGTVGSRVLTRDWSRLVPFGQVWSVW